MTTNHAAPHTALRLSLLLPWLILITTLGVTWLVRDHEQALTRNELRTQLDFSLREMVKEDGTVRLFYSSHVDQIPGGSRSARRSADADDSDTL